MESPLLSAQALSTSLIEMYKSYPSLWDPGDEYYRDMRKKSEIWGTIASSLGMDVSSCRRKMESILASLRRERRSRRQQKLNNKPYKTTWVHWDALYFLRALRNEEDCGIDEFNESPCEIKSTPKTLPSKPKHKRQAVTAPTSPPVKAPKVVPSPAMVNETPSAPQQSTMRGDDEYSAIGITVEAKLRRMRYDQRLYAENLINQTLYKGLMLQLTKNTRITNKKHSERVVSERPAFVEVPVKKGEDILTDSSEEEMTCDDLTFNDDIDDTLLNIKTRVSDSSDND